MTNPASAPPLEASPDINPIWGEDVPLELKEAAAFIGMPLPTLKQKIYSREIASLKVGRRRKVRPSAVRAYLRQHELPAI